MIELELLAPAKNLELGKAAINAGADAVYIGADMFGARKSAGNSIDDIRQLIEYAHKFFAKVYCTVNTIFSDSESEMVRSLIYELYTVGADAIIIQDLGILEMELPPIAIFASTQTNNYHLDRIKMIESAGVQRIILARELSLPQIKEIANNTECELESFVFGALCVSLSGMCYMSQATCNRSANRGECAQLCRHRYSLYNTDGKLIIKDKYLLSLKDLNLESKIEAMISAGITSFKIEGRLKDINYVINSVAYFRNKLDEVINSNAKAYKRASSGRVEMKFQPDLRRTFNRGFTEYFISEQSDNPANINSPKSSGEYIGEVITASKNKVFVKTNKKINAGDGLSYYKPSGELCGFRVNRAEGNTLHLYEPVSLKSGTKLYRNQDTQFEKELSANPTERKVALSIEMMAINEGILFRAIDEDNITAEEVILCEKQLANSPAKAIESIRKQMSKCGDTIFRVAEVNNIEAYFIPIAELNSARRNLFAKLEQSRINASARPKRKQATAPPIKAKLKIDYSLNIMNSLAEKFYCNHCEIEGDEIAYAPEHSKEYSEIALMTNKYCIREQVGLCPKLNKDVKSASDLILKDDASEFVLKFDCKSCFMRIYNK